MAQNLNLKISKAAKLINFLNKFSPIDNSLLIEMNETEMKAKNYTVEKALVKYSAIPLSEIFSEYSEIKGDLKFGVHNIKRLVETCKFFGDTEFDMTLECSKINGETIGTLIVFKNSILTLEFQCAPLKLLNYVDDNTLNKKVFGDLTNAKVEFALSKENYGKVLSLFKLEDTPKVTFVKKGKKVTIKGSSFEILVVEDDNLKTLPDHSLSTLKTHYGYLDNENQDAYLMDDRIVFISKESDTKITIGEAD